jgi:hypothetical protein
MNQKVPHCDKIELDIGTRKNPALSHVTREQRDDLFVYQTKKRPKVLLVPKLMVHKSQINKKSIN